MQAYSAIAEYPNEQASFLTGRALAENLGYPADMLDALPVTAIDAFCGISNVSLFAEIPEGTIVLDLGCGAGLDTLIVSRRTGENGKVIAIDFSPAMLARTQQAVAGALVENVETYLADAEHLPLEDESIGVAIVNGIFNLNPYREKIFSELARVVSSHGVVYAAELVLTAPLPEGYQQSGADWYS